MILFWNIGLTKNISCKRYDAYDIFLFSLRSYARLPVTEYIINMEVNESGEYSHYYHKCDEIRDICTTLFQGKKWSLEFKRIKTKQEHVDLFSRLIDEYGENEPIFYQTNFNHPFIDFNMDMINECIEFMRADATRFKCCGVTQFPNYIRICANMPDTKQIGNLLITSKFKSIDTFAIMNLAWPYHLINKLEWAVDNFKSLKWCFWSAIHNNDHSGRTGMLSTIKDADYISIVPLREQCRRIDAGWKQFCPDQLVIPEEKNVYDNSSKGVTKKMLSLFCNNAPRPWGPGNPSQLPREWLETGIRLAAQDPRMHKEI